jgi:hypothetical protein
MPRIAPCAHFDLPIAYRDCRVEFIHEKRGRTRCPASKAEAEAVKICCDVLAKRTQSSLPRVNRAEATPMRLTYFSVW